MTALDRIEWDSLLWEARGFLELDDAEPVPADELVEQAKANGYGERETRQALRDADELEAVGDVDELRVRLAEEHVESNTEEPETDDANPTTEAQQPDGVGREAAVEALRDVLEFYNERVDDEIADHTDAGDHPERPTTAREYYTDIRGWDSDTVDELLLGWAPPDHTDQLVAWLHDRGHSREAILATGAVGETDTGGLYTTFSGRYVLPYYDAGGEPAYAIARATGGEGGGAKGYGGHPRDYQAGKYAKLRHTDERVPFDEPIYGLDTLSGGDHVVVAEGIADAITARERGYAVLSPVAKQFKESHYDPLVSAFEAHTVERVTIVGDADSIRNGDAEDHAPESVRDAVATALSPAGAGLAGALRTAATLDERADLDVRVTLPPAPGDLESDLDEFVNGAWGGDLAALVRSARPATAFREYDDVVDDTAEEYDAFDADEYEPTATEAGETTDDVRDLFAAIDRLDAHRVADRTIVREWLDENGDRRTFAPTWAPASYTGTANFVDRDKWVDTGERGGRGGPVVMAAIDAGIVRDTEAPDAVSGQKWWKGVERLRELGFSIPEYDAATGESDSEEYGTDPREVSATVDPRRAWDAAERVTPSDLDDDGLDARSGGGAFACPCCGGNVDVVRAVAVDTGLVGSCDAPLSDHYPTAYNRAREQYGAPLPRYYTTADAVAEFSAVLDVIAEVDYWHLDADALASDVTAEGDDVSGEAVRALNPAWRESESGKSVLVFDSGTVWDADTERSLDVLRFVALDAGIIDHPDDELAGDLFTGAYRRAREQYGAPLPRWEPALDGNRDITPMLPPTEELLDGATPEGVDTDALDDAREEVEELIGRAARGDDGDDVTVVTALPALGKTTGTVKTARETPLSYLAPRKELQAQALDKADRWGVEARILPVFAEGMVRDEVLNPAVSYVREEGKDRLRDRWSVLNATLGESDDDGDDEPDDIFVDDDDSDEVELDRPTCETADGEHGRAWALAVHVARAAFELKPSEIHEQAQGIFGAELPCTEEGRCSYTEGWDRVRDADEPADLLVGSYVHQHVPATRTHYSRNADGSRERSPRAVVLDEFVGEAYVREYDEKALDFATWLARALRDDVADRRDMLQADLWGDEFLRAWLDGEAAEHSAVEGAARALGRMVDLLDGREAAGDVLDEVDDGLLDTLGLAEPLRGVVDKSTDATVAYRELFAAVEAVDPDAPGAGVAGWVSDDVLDALDTATDGGASVPDADVDVDALPISGDLRELVEEATEAAVTNQEGAHGRLRAAVTALSGGQEGCRRLAAWATDGYAHPNAHHFLHAAAAPTEGDEAVGRRVGTCGWAFDPDATEGTVLDVVDTGSRARTVLDRNDHGALLQTPPSRTAGDGSDVPVIGLDATGRAELWENALRFDVTTRDIHDTPAERAAFLENTLDLRILQASDRPRPYSGDPESKDTDGDVALLEALAEEYSGIDAPRERGGEPVSVGSPATITSKGVREVLENDSRLDDVVCEWEHFGNLTGANHLGGHRLAAILGSQHYGDDAVERFAALAGQEVDTTRELGRGAELDYGNDLANAYLGHMREDQVMQAVLRFARGDSGATVVARTSALRADLPVVGDAQVAHTWSDTATAIARQYRRLGDEFTAADVADVVDVTRRHVGRVLTELVEAGYLERLDSGVGRATVYGRGSSPGAGEVELPDRLDAVDTAEPGQDSLSKTYTWNVGVGGLATGGEPASSPIVGRPSGAPPAPTPADGGEPPG